MEVGPKALPGLVEPCGVFLFHLPNMQTQKLHIHDFISLMVYDPANYVLYA